MAKDFYPGDVEISRCMMTSLDGKREFNVIGQVAYIDIFEGITQPLITGDIVIRDSIGLLRSFPIIGEEQIELEFATPTLGKRAYKLNVERVSSVDIDETNKSLTYTLHVVSPEQFVNATSIVSQRFRGQISASIETILTDYLKTSKSINIRTTTGIDDQLITNLAPLQAIDKLRHRALSAEFSSSSFAFFENTEGFHFVTIEELLRNARKPVAKYYFDDSMPVEYSQVQFRDMINFYQPQTQATTEKLRNGALGSVVKKYDMITGNIEDVVFDEQDHVGTFEKTGQFSRDNTSSFLQANKQPAVKMIMPWTPDKDVEELADKQGLLSNFVGKIMQNIAHINVFGDSNLNLGDSLECTFVNGRGTTGNDKQLVTNRFVIAKIRHCIHNSSRPVYSQAIEGINNSFDS